MGSETVTAVNGNFSTACFYQDLYNDAMYHQKAYQDATDEDQMKRHGRAALVFHCACADASINSILHIPLLNKVNNGMPSADYKTLLRYLKGQEPLPPKNYMSIEKKLYNYVHEIIAGKTKTFGSVPQFEEYIKISRVRNNITHYSASGFDNLYSPNKFNTAVDNAPKVIKELFEYFHAVNNAIAVPRWYTI